MRMGIVIVGVRRKPAIKEKPTDPHMINVKCVKVVMKCGNASTCFQRRPIKDGNPAGILRKRWKSSCRRTVAWLKRSNGGRKRRIATQATNQNDYIEL